MFRVAIALAFLLSACHKPPAPVVRVTPTPPPTYTPPPVVSTQQARWDKAEVRKEKEHFVLSITSQIQRSQARYQAVANATKVPWRVIASLHNMECSLSFRQHLHNGDPLTARTHHVPAGRPATGAPPFAWETSAVDALQFDKLDRKDWSRVDTTLQNIEGYNGTGYQRYHPTVPTPYLWSWTTLYTRGKYIEDGKWSPTAVSDQCGVVPLLKEL